MDINRSALSKQHRVQHYAAANDAFDFFNMLTSPDLLDTLEASLPEHRERLFPPTETLSKMTNGVRHHLNKNTNQWGHTRLIYDPIVLDFFLDFWSGN